MEAAASTPNSALLTFLIADIRGYTRFTVEQGDEAGARLASAFADLARECVTARNGEVIELRGDEALAVFASPRQALRAARELQAAVGAHSVANQTLSMRVGIGIDTGEAVAVEGGYRGAALNLAARLCSLAGAGEVLASDTVTNLAHRVEGLVYAERGLAQLKGFDEPIRVFAIEEEDDDEETAPDEVPTGEAESDAKLPIGGFLGALPSGVIVGRDAELARVLESIESTSQAAGRLVLLAGEPGVGKTRLAQEATLQARNREFLVVAGRCYEQQQAVSFYPLLEALASLFALAPAAIRGQVARRWAYLGQLLPDQVGVHPVAAGGSADDQQRLLRAVTGFIQAVAETQPVALFLDDLQWADHSSLDLLQHLARATRTDRVFILGTYRDVEVTRRHPLEAAVRDLQREGLVERIDIRRLDESGTSHLIGAALGEAGISAEFTHLIHGRTEGNPYFVQQVVRALVEHGDVFRRDGRWTRRDIDEIELPESIRSVIGQRVDRLPADTQEILRDASVLGQTFDFDDLLSLRQHSAGTTEEELEASLEQAAGAGLLRAGRTDAYGFDHALTQQTLYGELPPRRRRRLHLAAGEALERLSEVARTKRAAELAWHFVQADDAERGLLFSLLAGDQAAALHALADAEEQYRTALDLTRETGDRGLEASAHRKLAEVMLSMARYDDALVLLEEAAAGYRASGQVEEEALAIARLGETLHRKGDSAQAQTRIEAGMKLLEGYGPTPAGVQLHIGFYRSQLLRSESPPLWAAERAVEIARELDDDGLLLEARTVLAAALANESRIEEALAESFEIIPLAEARSDLWVLHRALSHAASALYKLGRIEEGREYFARATAAAEIMSDPFTVAYVFGQAAFAFTISGEWADAHRNIARGRAAAAELGTYAGLVHENLEMAESMLAVAEGNCSALEEIVERWQRESSEDADPGGSWIDAVILAHRDLLLERPTTARDRLLPFAHTDPARQEYHFLVVLAEASVGAGALQQAVELATRVREYRASHLWPALFAEADKVYGQAMAAQGKWPEAAAAFERAIATARQCHYPDGEARTLRALGLALAERGDRDAARARLEEALAIFRRLGVTLLAERAERDLAKLD